MLIENKYVQRQEYFEFLKGWKDKHIIKVITGVRRSGKSTLLFLFRKFLLNSGVDKSQIISINFEDINNTHLTDAKVLHEYILQNLNPKEMNYIFLDEIQNVESYEKVVNSLFLKDNIDLYITGSNAYMLSGELATYLTGRYIELKILPLSFREYVTWHKSQGFNIDNNILFENYLKSSFPYTLFIDDDRQKLDYLQGIYSTVLLQDIVTRLNIQDVRMLERLIQTLFSSIGSLITVNKIKNTIVSSGLNISNVTVDRYVKGILESLIMYEARRYDIRGRGLLDTQSKFYAVDLGLRGLIVPDHVEDFGHIIENIVFLELLRRGNFVYVGRIDRYEVDFVTIDVEKNINYYQVSLTTLDENVLNRELRSLKSINDSHPKYLLTLDTYNKEANYDGIQKLNIIDWLLK